MTILDRNSPIPLYYQLKNILLAKIETAVWQPGDLIPSELELQEKYELSRTTVRQTLSELVNDGWLNRHRGRGTFVTRPKMTHDPVRRLGATEYLQQQGIQPGWRLISADWATPADTVYTRLKVRDSEKIYRIHRLRLANKEPIGFHYAYLPAFMVAYINEDALNQGGSLRYLRSAPQMEGSLAHRSIEATLADDAEINQLGSGKGDPILAIERIILAADDTPIELLWAAYRGDRFKYQISI
ncbi:MAG: GntR family transcriptional regulator [Chloroflexi bacterium]|nr:GntR family transcriptional regulator [Chloroflexota bacterium]